MGGIEIAFMCLCILYPQTCTHTYAIYTLLKQAKPKLGQFWPILALPLGFPILAGDQISC